MPPLELVDPTTNPHLSGRFAPVHREIDAGDLTLPRARVHIPHRVPNGLHGNWFAAG